MATPIFRSLVSSLLLAGVALLGCSSESPEKLIAAAKQYVAQNDPKAATIQLKNALQQDPNSSEARFLLGKILLEAEEPGAAAIELGKASELKYPEDAVDPLMAKALLMQNEPQKVIDRYDSTDLSTPAAAADLKTTLAAAFLALRQRPEADAALLAAFKAVPDHAPAMVLQARVQADDGDISGAKATLDRVLEKSPANPDALVFKGDLLQGPGEDAAGASALYRKALVADPRHRNAHAALINLLLAGRDLEGAKAQLEVMKKVRPDDPQTLLLEARLALQQGNTKVAGELVPQLLKIAPTDPQVLELAGFVAFQKGDLLQAENYLRQVLQLAPLAKGPRHLLARMAMNRGDPAKAIDYLQPLLDSPKADAVTLSLAGTARMQSGDGAAAEALFLRAVKQSPSSVLSKTALALVRLDQGDASGLRQLEEIAGADTGDAADLALINAELKRRNFDAALKAVDRLIAKQPGKPGPLHLRGQIFASKGDVAAAKASFEAALAADPKFFPAVDGLAQLDLRENNLESARARFEAAAKLNPQNVQALLAVAALDERAGKPEAEVAAGIAKAIAASPTDPRPRVQLVNFHLRKGNFKSALAAAQEAAGALPNDPLVVDALARAHFYAGEREQALAAFSRLATLLPTAPEPLLAAAGVQMANKDVPGALTTLKKAHTLAPDHPQANRSLVEGLLQAGKPDEAAEVARGFRSRHPELALGDELLGDVQRYRGSTKEAVAAYQAALRKQPNSALAQKTHAAQIAAGQNAQARALEQSWLKEHPGDADFLMYLGGVAIGEKAYSVAQARFGEVVKLQPANAQALNNLAWAMHAMGSPGALEPAERANRISPDVPTFMDTLALILADSGQVDKAMALQRRALEKSPDSPSLRLTLAKIYIKAGDKEAARGELSRLRTLGADRPERAEAEALLSRL